MTESVVIFENEEAARLLNYFISYKKIVNKNENHQVSPVEDRISFEADSRPEVFK